MRALKSRATVLLMTAAALLALYGCDTILDGETMSISPHMESTASPSVGFMEAETYDEIKDCMLSLILEHKPENTFRVNISYEGDVQNDIDRACYEIPRDDPIGAYAVSEMVGTVKQIISYYEVELSIAYTDVTKEQLENIVTVSTARDLDQLLLSELGEYARSFTALVYGVEMTEKDARDSVSRLYYENPGDIVMVPVTTVDFYPKYGSDRIIKYTFGYRYEASTLQEMEQLLKDAVLDMAGSAAGDDGMLVLLTLAQRLMDSAVYDEETAAGGDYSNQNVSATAYSALISGSAVSEGYAMAFKALCDKLGVECTVVIGRYAGALHAWNIVGLEGNYYHIDVCSCDRFGLETAFLKNDTEMGADYEWDTDAYPVCDGPLSYDDLPVEVLSTEDAETETAAAGAPASEKPPAEAPETQAPATETPSESPTDEAPAETSEDAPAE